METIEEQRKENIEPKDAESLESLQARIDILRRTILTLEWDEARNQINEAKRTKLKQFREQFNTLKVQENEAKTVKTNQNNKPAN